LGTATRTVSASERIARLSPGHRLLCGVLAAAMLALLGVAAWLTPAGAGHGSHTQLGLSSCGFAEGTGMPCPTCGMTTAFAHAADGSLWRSASTQPFGAALAVLTAISLWVAGHSAATGSVVAVRLVRGLGSRTAWVLAAGLGAAWAYKIAVWPGAG
jgi:hypothetical protein